MQGLHAGLDAFGVAAAAGVRRSEILAAGSAATEIYALPPVAEDRHILSEDEGKRALAAYSLTVPKGRIATAAEAPAAAKALGFPVVVKLAEPALAHKTEAGAVQLNLKSEAEVSAAVAAIEANLARYKPGAKAQKFLVEKMVGGVVAELIVGVKRDPQFGLVLVVGAGGILVELVEDAATLLLPTSRDEVAAALRGLKVAKLLKGYRGKPAGDLEAAIEAVMAVVAYADAARDKLVELDVNPLMVLPKGQGVVAVDALVVTAA